MIKQRVQSIQRELTSGQALLVTADCNRFYFTGFASSAGSVFICPDAAVFLIDFRYYEKAKATAAGCDVILQDKLFEQMGEAPDRVYIPCGGGALLAGMHKGEDIELHIQRDLGGHGGVGAVLDDRDAQRQDRDADDDADHDRQPEL